MSTGFLYAIIVLLLVFLYDAVQDRRMVVRDRDRLRQQLHDHIRVHTNTLDTISKLRALLQRCLKPVQHEADDDFDASMSAQEYCNQCYDLAGDIKEALKR